MISSIDICASGLYSQRVRMDVISNNLANVNTTRDSSGKINPYRRKEVIFVPTAGEDSQMGVSIPVIKEDERPFRKEYNPTHPDAIKEGVDFDGDGEQDGGYVFMPNVNVLKEMVDMIDASRAYEANITAMDACKAIFNTSLRIIA